MYLNKDNIMSEAVRTTSSFYSISSFNKRILTQSILSNIKIFEKNSKSTLTNYHRNYLKHNYQKMKK